jgi:hypothetical protein
MRRALLVALSATAFVPAAHADGVDRAPLRGSAVYEAPAYPVELGPRAYPVEAAPTYVPPPAQPYGSHLARDPSSLPFTLEFGGRYWMSSGRLAKSLFDLPTFSGAMVSRLTYSGLSAQSFEAFGRVDHPTGLLLKGYVGLGSFNKGSLKDEDFPPFIDPYSATLSDQRRGQLQYATVDIGYTFWNVPQAGLAGFVGYNYLGERANGLGCTQTAGNPFVCVPTIPGDVLGITEDARFHSLRLGIAGELRLFDRLRINAEAAWVPATNMHGSDAHWLRIGTQPGDFSGPIPENGHGDGVQAEASLAYQATKNLSFGVGWRYWRLDTKGNAEFNGSVVGFQVPAQPLNFTTQRQGVFLQGAYKL